jgi:hypothetical protein
MDEVQNFADRFSDAANEFWTTVGDYLPKVFGALVLLVVALVAAKLAQWLVEYVLRLVGVDRLSQNKQVVRTLSAAEISIDVVSILGRIAFWVVIVIFGLTIADVLELTAMSDVMRDLLGYLPNVLAAAIVLTVTVAGARLLRDITAASLRRMQVDFAHSMASVVFYVLMVFGLVMAVDQLGFDTTILTTNITVIVAGVMLALALAFGLGGREVAGRMVESVYANFHGKPVRRK